MRIALIGAGPSGLATAKALVDKGLKPIIFEAGSCIGGMWSKENNRIWSSLRTNLSKYTCAFSSLPWNTNVQDFPTHYEIKNYLQNYFDNQLNNKVQIHFDSKISKIKLTSSGKFDLSWKFQNKDFIDSFDKVIVANGFFMNHKDQKDKILGLDSFNGGLFYSDNYDSPERFKGRKVMVVGGSFSGVEIAAEIAKEASSVIHVVPHHSYVIPRYVPEDPLISSSPYLPIDLAFYQANSRRIKSIREFQDKSSIEKSEIFESKSFNFESIFKTPEEIKQSHAYFTQLLGKGNDVLRSIPKDLNSPCNVIISDDYKQMIKAEAIKLIPGKLKKIEKNLFMINSPDNSEVIETDIDDCIFCTGYEPDVSIFDEDILKTIEYQPDNMFSPFILYKDMFHPKLPGLFFVGMYRGPYFSIIENQSKLIANYLSESSSIPSHKGIESGLSVARDIRSNPLRGQFPHSDYVGLLLDLSAQLNELPNIDKFEKAKYITPFCLSGNDTEVQLIQDASAEFIKGKNVAKWITYSLDGGKWKFSREIFDKLTSNINFVDGEVTLTRVNKTSPLLWYHEKGMMTLANGQKFEASQSYLYSYNDFDDSLDISFSTVGNPTVIDRHFLTLNLKPSNLGWVAQAKHLCGEDNYYANYTFNMEGYNCRGIDIIFDVEGPAKNYRSITKLTLIDE